MRFGLSLPNVGVYADARALADLAREAEAAGWDGVFLWDSLHGDPAHPVPIIDPWVALTAIALATGRVRLGPMVTPVARRRPWVLAQVMAELAGGGHRPDPSLDEQLDVMLTQYDEMLELYGTHTGVNLARKHIGWYTKGLPGSAELRNRVNQQDNPAVVIAMLRDFYAPWLERAAA